MPQKFIKKFIEDNNGTFNINTNNFCISVTGEVDVDKSEYSIQKTDVKIIYNGIDKPTNINNISTDRSLCSDLKNRFKIPSQSEIELYKDIKTKAKITSPIGFNNMNSIIIKYDDIKSDDHEKYEKNLKYYENQLDSFYKELLHYKNEKETFLSKLASANAYILKYILMGESNEYTSLKKSLSDKDPEDILHTFTTILERKLSHTKTIYQLKY